MTDRAPVRLDWVPEACTLPTAEQPLRLAEFDALLAGSVRGGERLGPRHLRMSFSGGAQVAAKVRDLAARESECCSFFTFTVASQPAEVRLDVEVPAGYIEVLDALEQQVSAAVRSRP